MARSRYPSRGRSLGTTNTTSGSLKIATSPVSPTNFTATAWFYYAASPTTGWQALDVDDGSHFVGIGSSGTGFIIGAQSENNALTVPLFEAANASPTVGVWYFVYLVSGASNWIAGGRKGPYGSWIVSTAANTAATTGTSLYVNGDGLGDANFPGLMCGVKWWAAQLSQQELMREATQLAPVSNGALISYMPFLAGRREELGNPGLAWALTGSLSVAAVPAPVPEVISRRAFWQIVPASGFPGDDGDPYAPAFGPVNGPELSRLVVEGWRQDEVGNPIKVDEEGIPNAGVPVPFLPDALGVIRPWQDEIAILGIDEEGIPNAGRPPPFQPEALGQIRAWQDDQALVTVDEEGIPNAGVPAPVVPDALGQVRTWNDDGIGAPLPVDDEGKPIGGPVPFQPFALAPIAPWQDEPGLILTIGVDEEGAPLGRPLPPIPDMLGPILFWQDEIALLTVDEESNPPRWSTLIAPDLYTLPDPGELAPVFAGEEPEWWRSWAPEQPPARPPWGQEAEPTTFLGLDEEQPWPRVYDVPAVPFAFTWPQEDAFGRVQLINVIWLAGHPIVPWLAGTYIQPVLSGMPIVPWLGATIIA